MNALATIAIVAAILYRLWRTYGPVEVVNPDHRGDDISIDRKDVWLTP